MEYGGPARALFPQLWGYKSAKSLVAVDFLDHDEDAATGNSEGTRAMRGFPPRSCSTSTPAPPVPTLAARWNGREPEAGILL